MKNNHAPFGLYLHVPFCASKCSYCDFYSFAGDAQEMDRYVAAMQAHFAAWADRFEGRTADTVYFGGGTPSLLGAARLTALLDGARRAFRIAPDAEITVECNPDSMDDALLRGLRDAGVNRLSIGVQSARGEELRLLGRRHTFAAARDAVLRAQAHGFDNLSLDLMYALPGQTLAHMLESVQALAALAPAHLSCYALKVEPDTPFGRAGVTQPDEDAQADMYLALCDALHAAGYEHYEISNWAKPGARARHNSRYWVLSDYLGLGPGAHSLLAGRRFAYARDLAAFCAGAPPAEEEAVGDFDAADEYLMLGLRTADGVTRKAFETAFGRPFAPYAQRLAALAPHGLTAPVPDGWRLTERGFLVSNLIIGDIQSAGDR